MVIVETPIFTKQVLDTLSSDEYRLFQRTLLEHPDAGRLISGSGGLRKVRWSAEGRGKRGGVRVIYYWFTARDTILLLFIYPKNVPGGSDAGPAPAAQEDRRGGIPWRISSFRNC